MKQVSQQRGVSRLGAVLWALFAVIAFLVFYSLLSSPRGGRGFFSVAVPVLVVLLGVLALMYGIIFYARRSITSNNEGLSLLAEGRASQALDKFLDAQKKGVSSQAPLFHYNVAYARLLLWQLPASELGLIAARKKTLGTNLTRLVVPQHALVLALLGKSGDSRRVIAEAEAAGMASHATVLVARAVLAAREKNWSEVETLVRRQEVKQLGGTVRALADALKAWAVLEQTGQRRHVDRITLFGEAGPAQVQQHWPELAAFLEAAPQE